MVLLILLGLFLVTVYMNKKADQPKNDILKFTEKRCPPHKWENKEVLDEKGNKLGEHTVCSACNRVPLQDT